MDWTWGPANTWHATQRFLEGIAATLPAPPKAILVISGHWEEPAFTASAAARPELPVLRHAYPDFAVTLHPFLCEGPDAPRTALSWGWFTRAEMARLAMPEASRGLLQQIP